MATQTVILSVRMSCEGCSGAVKRVLSKMEGVESFDIDMKQQKVTVKGNVEPELVLQTVAKTGKRSSFWEEEVAPPDSELEPKAAEVQAETEAEVKTKAKAAEIEEVETEAVVKTRAVAEVEVEVEEEKETTSMQTEKAKPEEEPVVAST